MTKNIIGNYQTLSEYHFVFWISLGIHQNMFGWSPNTVRPQDTQTRVKEINLKWIVYVPESLAIDQGT